MKRLAALIGGVVVVWVVVASPLAHLHHQYLLAHMAQHLLLSLVAAPLFLLAAPTLPLPDHPVACWSLAMLVFLGWHYPPLFQLAWRSEGWHLIEAASFLISGLLFWRPVIQPWPGASTWPRWSMPIYLFLATLPCDVLSAFLAFSDRLVYPAYAHAHGHSVAAALTDQAAAGALMWLCVTFAYGVPASIIMLRELSPRRERDYAPILTTR